MNRDPIPSTEPLYRDLVAGLGADEARVSNKRAQLLLYSRDFSAVLDKGMPQLLVMPRSVEEVQEILRSAHAHRTPVVPYSAGLGLGTWLPREGGVMVDLRKMNQLLEVNEECLYILVEPGLSYAQLSSELVKRGLVCSIPDAPPAVSVLANHTVFGYGSFMQEYGLGPELVLGVEVVLPGGEVIRTGSAAMAGSSWHSRQVFSPLPDLTGLFLGACGTLGIITKAAIRVYPAPENVAYRKFGFKGVQRAATAVRELSRARTVDRVSGFSWFFSREARDTLSDRITGESLTMEQLGALRNEVSTPEFFFYMGIHGLKRDVDAREKTLIEVAAHHEAIEMEMTADDREKYHSVVQGKPQALSELAILGRKGKYEGGYESLVTHAPLSKWSALYDRWNPIAAAHGHPLAINTKLFPHGRFSSFRFIISYFNPDDLADRQRITAMKGELEKAAMAEGVPLAGAPASVLKQLASYPVYRAVKQALDPHGIMHPAMGEWAEGGQ
jgi:FAD/FMN-containing dehydrogenase